MATATENLGMTLPDTTDPVDVTVLNGNFSALDTFAGTQTEKDTAQDGRLTDLETSDTAQDATLVRLTDAGAKNLAKLGFDTLESVGITVTRNEDGSLTLNGTSTKSSVWILIYDLADGNTSSSFAGRRTLPAGRYFLKGTGDNSVRIQIFGHDGTNAATLSNTSNDAFVNVDDTWPYHCLRLWIAGGASFDHQTIWPMLCKAEDYAVSTAFTPYAPTLRELYEMVLALQSGGGAS